MGKAWTDLFGGPNPKESSGNLAELTRALRRYSVEQQQVPKQLEQLVALNYLESIPSAPSGQRYVIDRRKVEVKLV